MLNRIIARVMHVLVVAKVVTSLLYLCGYSKAEATELVNRRTVGDTFTNYGMSVLSTCSDNEELNLLVHEGECVTNQALLQGEWMTWWNLLTCRHRLKIVFSPPDCRFSVAPNDELSHSTLILVMTIPNSDSVRLQMIASMASTVDSSNNQRDAVIVYNETRQLVSSSLCSITSLEVYRGRGQSFEIDYGGLSLNESGNIRVSINNCAMHFSILWSLFLTIRYLTAWHMTQRNILENCIAWTYHVLEDY